MTTRALVATDLSELADEALRQGHAFAEATGGALAVCHVIPNVQPSSLLFPHLNAPAALATADLERRAADAVEKRVTAVTGRARGSFEIFVEVGADHAEILKRAEAWRADRTFVGSAGRTGVARLLLGSVAEMVVRYSHGPVLVARAGVGSGKIVLVATDMSEPSVPAVTAGAEEARRRGLPLRVVHAVDMATPAAFASAGMMFGAVITVPSAETQREVLQATRKALEGAMKTAHVEAETAVLSGPAAEVILRAAEEESAALIVVGTRGRTGIARIALGSVAERVVRGAHCSVLAVRLTPS